MTYRLAFSMKPAQREKLVQLATDCGVTQARMLRTLIDCAPARIQKSVVIKIKRPRRTQEATNG